MKSAKTDGPSTLRWRGLQFYRRQIHHIFHKDAKAASDPTHFRTHPEGPVSSARWQTAADEHTVANNRLRLHAGAEPCRGRGALSLLARVERYGGPAKPAPSARSLDDLSIPRWITLTSRGCSTCISVLPHSVFIESYGSVTTDVKSSGTFRGRAVLDVAGMRSVLAVPLRKDGALLGAIHIYRQKCGRSLTSRSRWPKISRRRRSSQWRNARLRR